MLGSAPVIAFVPSTDLARSRQFYEEVVDLAVAEVTSFACVLRAGGTMVRVTLVEQLTPQPFTVLGWSVAEIGQAMAELTARGAEFAHYAGMDQDDAGVWTTPTGDSVAWFKDPDGNTLSVAQFASGDS